MPKRRYVRNAKGQFAPVSGAAGKRRGVPHGKMLTLYHFTRPDAADSIVAQQKIRPGGIGNDMVHFSNRANGLARKHGKAAVSVQVPFRKTKKLPFGYGNTNEFHVQVHRNVLAGRKIRRVL